MSRAHRSPLLVPSFLLALLLIVSPHVAGGDERKPSERPASLPVVDLPEGRTISADSDLEKRIRTALDEPANLQYLDTHLSDIANDLSLRYKIPVHLDAVALTADGKGPDTTLSLSVREGSLRNALRLLLGTQALTFVVRNDTLLFTTKTAAEAMTSTRIYQVHDLVVMPNDPTATHPDFDTLIDIVTRTIRPESWREAGGVQGDVNEFRGPGALALVVTQTDEAHEHIEALLKSLRAAREPKVQELQRHAKTVEEQEAAKRTRGSDKDSKSGGGFF